MLCNFDLAGAEWVVTAYLCRDPAMLDVVRSGRSPHPVTGSRMTNVSEETIVAEDKLIGLLRDPDRIKELRLTNLKHQLSTATFLPRTMSIRQAAKKANHGGNYREGYKMFALMNELEEKDAKAILAAYTCQCDDATRIGHRHTITCKPAYPLIRNWWDSIDATLKKTRILTNCFGRKCFFMGQIGNDMFKQGYAFIPQSTVVDSCNQAMVRFMEDPSPEFAPAEMRAQVHDSLLFDYLSTDFKAMAAFAIKLGLDYMRPILDYGEPFQLGVDLKVGFDWAKMSEIKLTPDVDALAEKLRVEWDKSKERRTAA